VIPEPIDFFGKIPASSGLHLVNIPFTKTFEDLYTLGEFTKQDYPNLLPGQDRIDTIAVPAVLAVFNWQKSSDGYNRVERFIQYLFSRWDTFQHPPYHPKWRDVKQCPAGPGSAWQSSCCSGCRSSSSRSSSSAPRSRPS